MIKETIQRLSTAPANEYWAKVKKIAIGLVVASGVVVALPTAGLSVPVALLTGAKYIIAIGATLGISAQATK